MVILDFETRSPVDLKKCGSSVYARDLRTDVLCLAYKIDDRPVELWKPSGLGDPHLLFEAIRERHIFYPHNAGFERQIWFHICHKRWGLPV